MATKYNMREMNDLNGKGIKLYPQLFSAGVVESDQVAEAIAQRCTLNEADVKGALSALSQVLSEQMANGYAVKLEGIGLFSAALTLKKGKEKETRNSPHRNAQSIEIGKIKFRPEKRMLAATNAQCILERTTRKFDCSISQYTLEQRIELARKLIQSQGRMKISEYVQLTGLSRSKATRELRELALRPDCGLQAAESGPLRHYIWHESTPQNK